MTSDTPNPNYLSVTLAAWLLALLGWAGLAALIFVLPITPAGDALRPTPGAGPRWLFFVLWLMALTGTAVPFTRYLNHRFSRTPVPGTVLLRQSLWVGLFGATCVWLQIGRMLSTALVLLIAAVLIGVEWFLRMREHSRWVPDASDEPA